MAAYWYEQPGRLQRTYEGATDEVMRAQFDAQRPGLEAQGWSLGRLAFEESAWHKRHLNADYWATHASAYRGLTTQECQTQALSEVAEARRHGWELVGQAVSEDAGLTVLTVSYRWSPTVAKEAVGLVGMKPKAKDKPRGESMAHRSWNGLIQLWTLALLAVIFVPMLAANSAGEAGAALGLGAGLTAAAALFVPWLVVMIILLVLRSTTRAR